MMRKQKKAQQRPFQSSCVLWVYAASWVVILLPHHRCPPLLP